MPYSRVTRRRIREPYLDVITAGAPYARASAQAEEEEELTKAGLDLERQIAEERLALERKAMEEEKKRAEKAQLIGLGQTGLMGGYVGLKGYETFKPETVTPETTTPATVPTVSEAPAAVPSGTGLEYGEFGGSVTGEGAATTAGLSAAQKAAIALELGYEGYGLYSDIDRPSSEYKEGSKEKYGRVLGRVGMFGGVSGDVGAEIGGRVWPTAVKTAERVGREIGRTAERVGKEVERIVEDVADVAKDVWHSVTGCILFSYFYGPRSAAERYAKIYCGRHMNENTYLGYFIVGRRIINLSVKSFVFKRFAERFIARPLYHYVLYRLKGMKIPFWEKQVGRAAVTWFERQGKKLKRPVMLPTNCLVCYETARKEGVVY